MARKKEQMPVKRTMNLYYKMDRSAKPATIALYVLLVVSVLLGVSKVLIFDLWVQVSEAREAWSVAQGRLESAFVVLKGYDEVRREYQRLAATEEERAQIDRMEIVSLLDEEVGSLAKMHNYAVSDMTVQIQIDQVTLAETAEIVRRLELSPLVARTTVHTAATMGANRIEDQVSASILVELQKEVKADEKTAVSP